MEVPLFCKFRDGLVPNVACPVLVNDVRHFLFFYIDKIDKFEILGEFRDDGDFSLVGSDFRIDIVEPDNKLRRFCVGKGELDLPIFVFAVFYDAVVDEVGAVLAQVLHDDLFPGGGNEGFLVFRVNGRFCNGVEPVVEIVLGKPSGNCFGTFRPFKVDGVVESFRVDDDYAFEVFR